MGGTMSVTQNTKTLPQGTFQTVADQGRYTRYTRYNPHNPHDPKEGNQKDFSSIWQDLPYQQNNRGIEIERAPCTHAQKIINYLKANEAEYQRAQTDFHEFFVIRISEDSNRVSFELPLVRVYAHGRT